MPLCRRFALIPVLGLAVLLPAAAAPGGADGPGALGVAVQAYPAGLIFAVQGAYGVTPRSVLLAYAAYNVTDRRDFGEHDNEEGGGPGFGVAARRYLHASYRGFYAGARADVWFLGIDWEDDDGARTGTTDVTVLQPTAQLGYSWTAARGRLLLEANVALGAEINVHTSGEAVGEGAILLVGAGLAYRL